MSKKAWKPKIEYRSPSTLIPYVKNAKIHSKEQIDRVAAAITSFGFTQPIVVDKEGVIIAGHCRREASIALALKEVPVVVASHLTDDEIIAARIADNKVSEAPWNPELLKFDLKTLEMHNFKIELTGFKLPEIKSFLDDGKIPDIKIGSAKDSAPVAPVPPPPVDSSLTEELVPTQIEARVKLGDIYILGKHRLMCGDSTDIKNVEKLLEGVKVDLVFTDPPYGVAEKTNRGEKGRTQAAEAYDFKEVIGDETQDTAKAVFLIAQSLKANVIYWGANNYDFLPISRGWIVWDKRENKGTDDNGDAELAWTSFNKPIRTFYHLWKGMIKGSEQGEKRCHPTQKPIALAEWCFEKYGSPKTVLDLFGGSGSTLIACEKSNRQCFMAELDPHYCDVIVARWEKFTGLKASLLKEKAVAPQLKSPSLPDDKVPQRERPLKKSISSPKRLLKKPARSHTRSV